MGRLIDISPLVSPDIDVWPGDTPFSQEKLSSFQDGGNLDLGTMRTTYHVGAHTDAPLHYHPDGVAIADVPLDPFYGPCQVIDVSARRGERYGWSDLSESPTAPRLLLRTQTFPDPHQWNTDFAAPEPQLIERLGSQGTLLVGFDTPSTDLFASKDLPAHRALAKHAMANLEGLVLGHVPPGHYTLIALPLRIAGADASPVRAVLATDDER